MNNVCVSIMFILGFLSAVVLTHLLDTKYSKAYKARSDCEKSLPRDQICVLVITAVPKDKQNE